MQINKSLRIAVLLLGLLGIYNGKLAIYHNGKNVPNVVLPYSAEIFTNEDQSALKDGIYFEDQVQLSSLLEDFLS